MFNKTWFFIVCFSQCAAYVICGDRKELQQRLWAINHINEYIRKEVLMGWTSWLEFSLTTTKEKKKRHEPITSVTTVTCTTMYIMWAVKTHCKHGKTGHNFIFYFTGIVPSAACCVNFWFFLLLFLRFFLSFSFYLFALFFCNSSIAFDILGWRFVSACGRA